MSPRAHTQPATVDLATEGGWSWRRAIIFMVVTTLAGWSGLILLGYVVYRIGGAPV